MIDKLPVGVLYALMAACLFGISTPFAKILLSEMPPLLLGGLLYLGSGLGLLLIRLWRDKGWKKPDLTRGEWPWLLGAIVFGGMLGPVLLMFGLKSTSASSASLLLNIEAVLTAVIAWVIFKENADKRIVFGMLAIVFGGILLSWPLELRTSSAVLIGSMLIVFACLCWAIDNNLTRKVSGTDALFIAGSKGLIAGVVNSSLALSLGYHLPKGIVLLETAVLGFIGYGVSLLLFVLALRDLGTARTGAYFSTAPFIGAVISILLLGESTSMMFWFAALFMGLGVWLHLTENHDHEHTHEPLEHTHAHSHDSHHQHQHDFDWDGVGSHTHAHSHMAVTHKHPHFPDIHHRHIHEAK